MKNKRFLFCMLTCIFLTNGVYAQSILNKVVNSVDKGAKILNKTAKKQKKNVDVSDNEDYTDDTDFEDAKKEVEIVGRKSNIFDFFNGQDSKYTAFKEKFCKFKTTSATKTISLDGASGLKLGYFHDGKAFVATSHNGIICIDKNGKIIKQWIGNEQRYFYHLDDANFPRFDSGRILLLEREGNNYFGTAVIYDTDFNVVKKIPDVYSISSFEDGVAKIELREKVNHIESPKIVFIDLNGNEIMQELASIVNEEGGSTLSLKPNRPLREGLSAFYKPSKTYGKGRWGFRDAKGNIVIKAEYIEVQDFSNGLAAVLCDQGGNKKWGFIDNVGNMVIQPKYSKQPSKFDKCGLAMVINKEGKSSFINKNGEKIGKDYTEITPFCNGKAIYTESSEEQDDYYSQRSFLIDSNFKVIATLGVHVVPISHIIRDNGMNIYLDEDYKNLRYSLWSMGTKYVDGKMYLGIDENVVLLNETGDATIGGMTGYFSEGIAPANHTPIGLDKGKECGYVNEKGEWIIKFVENEF